MNSPADIAKLWRLLLAVLLLLLQTSCGGGGSDRGPQLLSISVSPTLASLPAGFTMQLTATGRYSDDFTRDLSESVSWTSSDATVASVDDKGLLTALRPGTVSVSAVDVDSGVASGDSGESATITVTAAELVSISVSPPSAGITSGLTQQFSATGAFSDGRVVDITTSVSWISSDSGIANIGNISGSHGLATGLSVGSVTITALDDASGVSSDDSGGSASLAVTAAELVSISVLPASASLPKGLTRQFAAQGAFTDGSVLDVTASVNWASSNTAVATISNNTGSNGLASAINTGATIISARDAASGISSNDSGASAALAVTPAELLSLSVSPAMASISQGGTQQFAATGTYTDASVLDLSPSVTWVSSDTAVATVSNAAGSRGLATGVGVGSAMINATEPLSGVSSDDSGESGSLTVQP